MRYKPITLGFLALYIMCLAGSSCNPSSVGYRVSVTNDSDLDRTSEVVRIDMSELLGLSYESGDDICVKDGEGNRVLSQLVNDISGIKSKYLIFQSDFTAGETKLFNISLSEDNPAMPYSERKTFCRFVPERMDDFAWENDKVAFRTYGPALQKTIENGDPAGLISSGIDCWLKRVEYPIIDKWYKKEQQGGSYHQDEGEGLDNYHVGTTRGCGGNAIIEKGEYFTSQNFTAWKIIENGPIRSIFELEYNAYPVGSKSVKEKKRITIDLGSSLYHCSVHYDCIEEIQKIGVGIAHHNSNGDLRTDTENNFMTYWEALGDSYLGTAIILDSKSGITSNSDGENNWINTDIENNTISYWAGFGWEKAGEFTSFSSWNKYLTEFSTLRDHPLSVEISKE